MSVESESGDGRSWAACAAVVLFSLAATGIFFTQTGRLLSFDAISLFSPYYTLLSDMSRAGEFLLWNPWSNCGSPDVAFVEMGSYSPLTILHATLTGGGHGGFLLYWLSIMAIAGLGFLTLGRHLGAPAWGSLVVTLSFLSSGFFIGHSTHTSWLYSFAFLPWLIWRVDRALLTRRTWFAVEAGALWGLSALAGHPAIVIQNGLLLGAWALGRSLFPASSALYIDAHDSNSARASTTSALFWALGVLLVVLLVGVVVLAPAYVAFVLEAPGYSDRAGSLARDIVTSDHRLYPSALAGLVSPYIPLLQFENPKLWEGTWIGLNASYIGSLVPVFALMALLLRKASAWRWWLVGLAILSLGLALGESLPLRGWLYDWLPPTRYFRHTAVFRAYFLFCVCVLALLGTRDFSRRASEDSDALGRFTVACLSLGLIAGVVYWITLHRVQVLASGIGLANLQFLFAWLGLPLLFVLARNARSVRNYIPVLLVLFVLVDGALSLVQSMPLMSLYRYEIPDPSERRDRSVETMKSGLLRSNSSRRENGGNAHLFHKTALLENYNSLNSRFHTRQGVGNANWFNLAESWSDVRLLRESASGLPDRIWFSSSVAEVVPSDATFEAFLARTKTLGGIPIVIHDPETLITGVGPGERDPRDEEDIMHIRDLPAAERLPVSLGHYGPTELNLTVTAPRDGWLLVTDRWARGWTSLVDGKPTKLWGGDYLFRAVELSQGTHELEFHYRPFGHPWFVIISWGTLASVLGVTLFRFWQRS